jgi:uncharacterized membrane protein (UPF0182 family)
LSVSVKLIEVAESRNPSELLRLRSNFPKLEHGGEGQLPELKRVIAAYGDHVVMDETLAGALAALFKETAPASPPAAFAPPGAPAKTSLAGPEADRAREALSRYNVPSSS